MTDRFQYRKVVSVDMVVMHTVFDLMLGRTCDKFTSKYAAKQWIKRNQEEFDDTQE